MNKNQTKKVGIKDIAAKAGVSIGTVDRVLHDRGEVKEETRKKIMKIVDDFGYTPNIFAKSLSSKKTTHLAVVIPDSSDNNPYWAKPVKGIQQATEELINYNTEVFFELFDASDENSYRSVLQKVLDQNPDGIVLNPVFKETSLTFIQAFDKRNIPYVFIDINLKGVNNLGYFGQDAEQSGRVAARLMDLATSDELSVLVVKQTNRKIFSRHIEARVLGFNNYFAEKAPQKKLKITTLEIDLLDPLEPAMSLYKALNGPSKFDGIFVPNSRAFKMAGYLKENNLGDYVTIAYDLVDQNVEFLKSSQITYLLSQKPEVQAHKAIWALFNFLVSKKEVKKTNYSAIDIIVKENIDYYYEVST